MKMGVEALRRNHPRSTGALMWQLGDNWPVISNSSIDHYGRWKAVHYMARRFFDPVLLSGAVDGTQVRIFGINDLLEPVSGTLEWSLLRFDGAAVRQGAKSLTLPANQSRLLAELDLQEEIGENPEHRTYRNDSYEKASQHYLVYRFEREGAPPSRNVSFFAPPKYLQLPAPELTHTTQEENGRLVVTVKAEHFAAYVELDLSEGYARISDNYFHLLPGEERRVEVVESEVPEEELIERLRVKSLAQVH
jgi:beta-mannosidase